jgi:hypothetical protein
MKKLILLAVVLIAGLLGYRWLGERRAYKAYEKFADAWARGDRVAAAACGDDDAVVQAFEKKALRGTPGGAAMEAFRGTLYAVESRSNSPEGDTELVVRQTILFDPPGVTTGIGGAMFARFRHVARVRKTGDGWKVVGFEPTYLEMGELRRRN